MWRRVSPTEGKTLPGLSSDWDAYRAIFGHRNLTRADAPRIADLALVAHNGFWNALHDAVESLGPDEEIAVWAEW
jgi:hypothetical protein